MNLLQSLSKIKERIIRHGKTPQIINIDNKGLKRIALFFSILRFYFVHPDYLVHRKKYFSNVELVLTTNCTLCCEDCCHYIPRYKKAPYESSDVIIRDLEILLKNVKRIDEFRVMGGEPLLYPELYKVISFLLKSEKIGIIEIVTNGTISLGEDIQSLFPSKKLNIYVSNYGELSRKLNEYISNSKINRTIANKDGYWKDHGGFSYQGKGIEELKKQFKKCSKDKCVLFQGKLYSCACAAFGSDLGVFKLEKDEFVDLRNSGSERSSITNNCEIEENSKLSQQLLAFKKRGFFTSCNYCYWGTDLFTDIEVAKQVKK